MTKTKLLKEKTLNLELLSSQRDYIFLTDAAAEFIFQRPAKSGAVVRRFGAAPSTCGQNGVAKVDAKTNFRSDGKGI